LNELFNYAHNFGVISVKYFVFQFDHTRHEIFTYFVAVNLQMCTECGRVFTLSVNTCKLYFCFCIFKLSIARYSGKLFHTICIKRR